MSFTNDRGTSGKTTSFRCPVCVMVAWLGLEKAVASSNLEAPRVTTCHVAATKDQATDRIFF